MEKTDCYDGDNKDDADEKDIDNAVLVDLSSAVGLSGHRIVIVEDDVTEWRANVLYEVSVVDSLFRVIFSDKTIFIKSPLKDISVLEYNSNRENKYKYDEYNGRKENLKNDRKSRSAEWLHCRLPDNFAYLPTRLNKGNVKGIKRKVESFKEKITTQTLDPLIINVSSPIKSLVEDNVYLRNRVSLGIDNEMRVILNRKDMNNSNIIGSIGLCFSGYFSMAQVLSQNSVDKSEKNSKTEQNDVNDNKHNEHSSTVPSLLDFDRHDYYEWCYGSHFSRPSSSKVKKPHRYDYSHSYRNKYLDLRKKRKADEDGSGGEMGNYVNGSSSILDSENGSFIFPSLPHTTIVFGRHPSKAKVTRKHEKREKNTNSGTNLKSESFLDDKNNLGNVIDDKDEENDKNNHLTGGYVGDSMPYWNSEAGRWELLYPDGDPCVRSIDNVIVPFHTKVIFRCGPHHKFNLFNTKIGEGIDDNEESKEKQKKTPNSTSTVDKNLKVSSENKKRIDLKSQNDGKKKSEKGAKNSKNVEEKASLLEQNDDKMKGYENEDDARLSTTTRIISPFKSWTIRRNKGQCSMEIGVDVLAVCEWDAALRDAVTSPIFCNPI